MRRSHALLLSCLALASCSSNTKVEQDTPLDPKLERTYSRGSLTGDGMTLLGPSTSEQDAAKGSPLGVNSFLWRATLDTLSFMPLASADPFGGVILTDWYEDPQTSGERYKVNALILDKTLRADGVKITVFKQRMENGSWRDRAGDENLNRRLEDTILSRARELRIQQMGR